MNKPSLKKSIVSLLIIICLTLCMSINVFAQDTNPALDAYKKYLSIKELFLANELDAPTTGEMLDSVMKEVLEQHPEIFSDVINSMIKTKEQYTSYFDAETYDTYFSDIDYYGIGVSVAVTDDFITVTGILNGPAQNTGIQPGDRIIKIDGYDVGFASLQEAGDLIKGAKDTTVLITIHRPYTDETKVFAITRGAVNSSSISYEVINETVGYIKIADFDGLQTWIDFCIAGDNLRDLGITDYIIDVRDNAGGDAAVVYNMLNQMIETKDTLLFHINTVSGAFSRYSRGSGTKFENLVVLANENSYSAAEVFAGVVKDLKLGVVLGTTTAGKGKGQSHVSFNDGSVLAVSAMEIILPSTGAYHTKGIIPNIRVENKLISPDLSYLVPIDYTKGIKEGSQSPIVKGVEQRLNLLGYLSNQPDENYDKRSVNAVKMFQKGNSLHDDGIINQTVINLLNAQTKQYAQQKFYEDSQLKAALSIYQ